MDQQWDRISERFSSLQEDMRQIKADMRDVNAALKSHEDEINEVKEEISTLEDKLGRKEKTLLEEIDRLSAYVARNNFVVMGVEEEEGVETAQVLENFLIRKLKMGEDQAKRIQYERVHRANAKMKPRPIKARCVYYADKVTIQKMSKNLKGTKYFISEDLPKRVRDSRNVQVPALKAARRAGKLAFFSRTEPNKLFVDHVWIPVSEQRAFLNSLPPDARVGRHSENFPGAQSRATRGEQGAVSTGGRGGATQGGHGAVSAGGRGGVTQGGHGPVSPGGHSGVTQGGHGAVSPGGHSGITQGVDLRAQGEVATAQGIGLHGGVFPAGPDPKRDQLEQAAANAGEMQEGAVASRTRQQDRY